MSDQKLSQARKSIYQDLLSALSTVIWDFVVIIQQPCTEKGDADVYIIYA
jgi:hypothetical protein